MQGNIENINKLRGIIYSNLDPIINQDYCLLDVPDHKNIGDNLIWEGELAYLKRLPYKMIYSSNLYLSDFGKIGQENIILLNGGGNFGDLYSIIQDFRIKVVEHFEKNKIIIFPITVHYDNLDNLIRDSRIFNDHFDITICARDTHSYSILKKYFYNNKILLIPDMAFCIDFTKHIKSSIENKVLLLKRKDKELNNSFDLNLLIQKDDLRKIEVSDWPTFNISRLDNLLEKIYVKIEINASKLFLKIPVLKQMVDPKYGLKSKINRSKYITTGVNFINQYNEIYTTRLHVFILGVLLNKKVHVIDNSYGKNKNFYTSWMQEFNNCELIEPKRK
ncbi:polysaccharide pyruvyl transferase family protein [Pontibacter sp. CAU 1760]